MGSIEFRVLNKVRCIHSIGNGNISFEYIINKLREAHANPDLDVRLNNFIDFENAVISFEDEGFDSYSDFFNELQKSKVHRKWAIYTKNEITHQTANMQHLFSSNVIEVEVFQNREMALAFLGITEEDLADY